MEEDRTPQPLNIIQPLSTEPIPPEQLYGLMGEDGITRLIATFYQQIPHDDILAPMYPEDDLDGSEERLRGFLMFRFGGPIHYIEQRGHRNDSFESLVAAYEKTLLIDALKDEDLVVRIPACNQAFGGDQSRQVEAQPSLLGGIQRENRLVAPQTSGEDEVGRGRIEKATVEVSRQKRRALALPARVVGAGERRSGLPVRADEAEARGDAPAMVPVEEGARGHAIVEISTVDLAQEEGLRPQ